MPSTLAKTATILAVARQPSGKSRAFSALRPGGLRRDRYQATKVDGIGRKPSGFTTPDGLRRSAKSVTHSLTSP